MATPEIPAEVMAEALQHHSTSTGCNGAREAVRFAWREAWDACTSVYEGSIETSVENQVNGYWENVYELLGDETSQMWMAFAEVVEKLQPGIGPWDRREMVAAIVAEFKAVIDDA